MLAAARVVFSACRYKLDRPILYGRSEVRSLTNASRVPAASFLRDAPRDAQQAPDEVQFLEPLRAPRDVPQAQHAVQARARAAAPLTLLPLAAVEPGVPQAVPPALASVSPPLGAAEPGVLQDAQQALALV